MNNFRDIRRQAGAITYRVADGHAQILLVTSLDTRRWIIPKGNIEKGSTPAQAAACEVAEEAGIEGEIIGTTSLGLYTYLKRLKSGERQPTTVEVYLLRAIRQLFDWPEKGRRDLLWLPVMESNRVHPGTRRGAVAGPRRPARASPPSLRPAVDPIE